MTISTDRLAAIEAAARDGCPTLPATVVELARELREQQDRVVAFAGRLQAWDLDDAAAEVLNEILRGPVVAPDYYELRRQRDALLAACQRLRGWAQSFLMDDHPAVVSVDDAIADATRGTRHHG